VVPAGPWVGLRTTDGVTENAADAESPVTVRMSLPETVTALDPSASVGTVNVHVKVPVEEVVTEVQVWVTIVPPAMEIEPIAVLIEKPVPVTVTEVPIGPEAGDREIAGAVTVNVADAVSRGTVPMSLPDRTTAYVPAAIEGTVNVHVKVPVEEVVTEVQVWVVGVAPLNLIVPIAVDTENPEPVTVTGVPIGPWVRDRVIAGVVTVKVADAVSRGTVETSLPEIVTV